MSAPLPRGYELSALPEAPRVDASAFAPDVLKAMTAAHVGLQLSQEFANLDNIQAKRELEAAQIKADKARNDLEMIQLDDARRRMADPAFSQKLFDAKWDQVVQATVAGAAQSRLAGVAATAQVDAGLPQAQAALSTQAAQNELAGAKADAASGFAGSPTPTRMQTAAAAQARGSWGVNPGEEGEDPSDQNPAFRQSMSVQEYDPATGNQVEKIVTINSKTGKVLNKSDAVAVTKPGEGQKSALQLATEANGLSTAFDLLGNVKDALTPYLADKKGGIGQGLATIWANTPQEGLLSVLKTAIGRAAQSGDTKALSAAVSALTTTLSSEEFGKTLTPQELKQLLPMLPQAADVSDPETLAQKLAAVEQKLRAKAAPLEERRVFERLNLPNPGDRYKVTSAAAAAREHSKKGAGAVVSDSGGAGKSVMDVLRSGGTAFYAGRKVKLVRDANGNEVLAPAD